MMAGFLVGTITGVYVAGFLAVKVPGSPRPVRVSAGRQLSSAVLGEQVLVAVEGSRMWATVLLGTGPVAAQSDVDPVVTAPPETKTTITGSEACAPTWTGTYRAGSWRPDTSELYQGDWTGRGINRGAAFYGRKPAGLGKLTSGKVYLKRLTAGSSAAQRPTVVLLGAKSKPSGWPAVVYDEPGPLLSIGEGNWWSLPSAWLSKLDSGAAGGIGIYVGSSAPYVRLKGSAMTLKLSWTRTS